MRIKLPYLIAIIAGGLAISSHVFISAQTGSSSLKELEGPYANHPQIQDLNDQIKSKNDELQKLKDASNSYKNKLDSARNNSKSIASQLLYFDNQITKLELDIKTTQLEIDSSKLKISSLELQIDKEQEESEAQKNKLREYIRLINKEDQRSYLEILLLNDSFAEFFNQIRYVEDIQSDVKKTIDRLSLLHDSLTVQKADIVNAKEQTEKLKIQLETKQSALQDQYAVKERILVDTKNNEYKYQRLISEAGSVEDDINNSISSISNKIKEKLANLRSGNTDAKNTLFSWPFDHAKKVTTLFHDQDYPFRYLFEHTGIDIRAPQGSPIRAPADGYVIRAKNNGYGYSYITLIHDNNISTLYGHVSKIFVSQDQFVQQGDIIGLSGAQPGTLGAGPFTTGPHLHFEVRLNGILVNPLQYLP